MNSRFARLCLAAGALAASLQGAVAQDTAVDLELVLAVDVSGSMDEDEKLLQRGGYVEAFLHDELIRTVTSGPHGRIAVAYVEWAGPASQTVIVPWRIIDGRPSAEELAGELASAPTARIRGTSISGALLFSAGLFEGNGLEGPRRVIDISGDGPNNMGLPVVPSRDAVLARGIVINGLPVTLKAGSTGGLGPGQLDIYYEDCVIGGPGAFILSVQDPGRFAEAIRRKLVLEIAGPAPALVPAALPAQSARVDCLIGEKTRPSWLDDPAR